MLQCIAVCCCSVVLQSLETVRQCVSTCFVCCLPVCCSVLQCVAVCCSVLQSVVQKHTATHRNTSSGDNHTATDCNTLQQELNRRHRQRQDAARIHSLHCLLQCVAVCCNVVQHGAVWCSVMQCVAVRCSVVQRVAVCCSVLQCGAACCSVSQCIAVCRSALQCVAVCVAV